MKNLKTAGQRRAFEEFKHLRDMEVMDIAEVRDYISQDMVSICSVSIYHFQLKSGELMLEVEQWSEIYLIGHGDMIQNSCGLVKYEYKSANLLLLKDARTN